jgi:uncharacterized membrane protein YfcA
MDEASAIASIGLIAGMLGGLAGIGGSIFILPALHIVFGPLAFGEPTGRPEIHHMYMAAAMSVNVMVSLPATIHHHREGAVRTSLLPSLLPASIVAMVLGVVLSNRFNGESLRVVLALFLLAYCGWNLRLIARPRRRKFTGEGRIERATRPRLIACGGVTGLVGGLLGLGGGFMLVPLFQLVCNMKLRNAIATSSAVLCVTAAIGAAVKIATLPQHGESMASAAVYAVLMAPTGILGALAGARLLHRIPVTTVRIIITVLIFAAATRLLG